MDVVRYTTTQRGARKAIHAGHMYTKHRQVKLGIAWRCDQRGACLGRIVVDQHDKVVTAADHTHGPDWGRCKAAECVQDIKRAAGTSRASTTSVIQPKVARVSTETTTKLPKNAALRKMVRRVKRQHLPPEPKSLDELDNIPRRFHVTLKGDRWLLYYEPEDEERMLVFSSNHHLKLLQRATYWVMDGTFKSAPKIVCQIYAIHVRQRGRPMFPPALWNCYSRAEQGLPRTTNTCEAWHRRLGTLVGKNHPSLYVFLDQLQEEVAVIDVECSRAEAGHSPQKRRAQYEVTDARVARIQARYEEYREADDVLSYLRAIGVNVAGNL